MRILITHIVTFIIVFSIAISNPLDSIIVELENTNEDTKKIELLNEIACKYSSKNPKLGLEYGERAVKLSMDTDYDEGLASSYNYMGINNSVLGNYYKSNEHRHDLDLDKEWVSNSPATTIIIAENHIHLIKTLN